MLSGHYKRAQITTSYINHVCYLKYARRLGQWDQIAKLPCSSRRLRNTGKCTRLNFSSM